MVCTGPGGRDAVELRGAAADEFATMPTEIAPKAERPTDLAELLEQVNQR